MDAPANNQTLEERIYNISDLNINQTLEERIYNISDLNFGIALIQFYLENLEGVLKKVG